MLVLALSHVEHLLVIRGVLIVAPLIIWFEIVPSLMCAVIARKRDIGFHLVLLLLILSSHASLMWWMLQVVLLSPEVHLLLFLEVLYYFMIIMYEFSSIRVLHKHLYRRNLLMLYHWMFLALLLLRGLWILLGDSQHLACFAVMLNYSLWFFFLWESAHYSLSWIWYDFGDGLACMLSSLNHMSWKEPIS